jgi:large subunit ribosomal protein L1
MAKAKDPEEVKATEETREEIEELQADMPEVELSQDAIAAKDKIEQSDASAKNSEHVEDVVVDQDSEEPAASAKAGKRSAKALREAEAEEERQLAKVRRDEQEAETAEAPKPARRQLPNPLHQHGKKYRKAAELIDKNKRYLLDEALDLVKKTATTKFDSSVELHVNLGVDPRQADQMVRASVVLPHGTGRSIRVAVFADGKTAEAAKSAGADRIGKDDLLADIDKGKLDFDLLIAAPTDMATLGRVAKILGPRGLMPNPKSGTVTTDVATAVKEAKAGKVEFRIDKQAIVHQTVGKASFTDENLRENARTFLNAILKAKPSAAKGTYVKGIAATTSMGPSVRIDASATISALSTAKK